MRAIKFTIVDILKCKFMLLFLIVFALVARMMMKDGSIIGLVYMEFAAIILSVQPFMQDQVSESGFINMLPLSRKERVRGRYMFGALLVLVATILGFCILCLNSAGQPADYGDYGLLALICGGVGLLVVGMQYMAFYLVGRFKSQQLAGIIMMLPGFLTFFGSQFLMDYALNIPDLYSWFVRHIALVSVALMAAGVMVWLLGIWFSSKVIDKRDMN